MSEAFVRFFVEMVGHYSLFMGGTEREEESVSSTTLPSPTSSSSFQREAFRKAVTSKSLRRFLEVFMETQMFTGFIQERDLRRQGLRGNKLCAMLVHFNIVKVYLLLCASRKRMSTARATR